jgi:hypothetical protein
MLIAALLMQGGLDPGEDEIKVEATTQRDHNELASTVVR